MSSSISIENLRHGLEELIELAGKVELTSAIWFACHRYMADHGRKPDHLVVSADTLAGLLAEAQTVAGPWEKLWDRGNLRLFGMDIEVVSGLPDGMYFVGETK